MNHGGKTMGYHKKSKRLETAPKSKVPMKRFSALVLGMAEICTVITSEDVAPELLGLMSN
jgi:hypothetical protein